MKVKRWRWRRNAVRRRSDVVEAWTRLFLGSALLVGAPLTGSLIGLSTFDNAQEKADHQRATSPDGRVGTRLGGHRTPVGPPRPLTSNRELSAASMELVDGGEWDANCKHQQACGTTATGQAAWCRAA